MNTGFHSQVTGQNLQARFTHLQVELQVDYKLIASWLQADLQGADDKR